tara:strand:- start:274 stop:588 length:315 start_codon:yes stop_codon:yes gene_type:complete
MNKSLALKNKIYLFFLYLVSLLILLYLIFFLINGDRGIISFFKVKKLNFEHKTTLYKLEEKNNSLTDKITRLNPNSLDLDYLDERVRDKTGYLENDEILIKFDN